MLSNIKELNNSISNAEFEKNQKMYMRTQAIDIVMDLFKFLSQNSESKQAATSYHRAEISQQAKKEIAIKMEHQSSIDWERDF